MTATTRRRFLQTAGAAGGLPFIAGCDPMPESIRQLLLGTSDAAFAPPSAGSIDLVRHVLDRVTWGARPGDDERVREAGVDAFLAEQLAPDAIDDRACDRRLAGIPSLWKETGELYNYNDRELLRDLTRAKVIRARYSRRQLSEVMVDFWTDHLNIVSGKGDCRWLKAADDREVVRRHALGRFRDLIGASATSPAMLIYLDGHDNKVETPGDRPNENYARELLELHTLGVHGGYTQRDVMEVARCLSGWTYVNRPMGFRAATVAFDPGRHDDGAKTVLGHSIPAGGGADDLERVLDIVCDHPSTAEYISTKLVRRFISDERDPTAVAAVADAFRRSGGEIGTTLETLFATGAFREQRGTLFKRPFRFVVSALRGLDARTDAPPALLRYLERMGHLPFQYPTPDGYPIEPGPWLGTMLWRWNFSLALARGRIGRTSIDASALADRAGGAEGVIAHLLGRTPRADERAVLDAADAPIALVLAAPSFQHH